MDRREFLRHTGSSLLALGVGGCVHSAPSEPTRSIRTSPNILIIMADDMGFSDLGCYGGEVRTPHIDGLARQGIRYTQFYNAARCCPTRASLLTGLYPHEVGMGKMVRTPEKAAQEPPAYQGFLNDRCVTIAEVLRTAGYRTYHAGKWHVGEFRPHWPTDRGFDRYWGLISGAANYFDITKAKSPNAVRIMACDSQQIHPPKEDFYLTDAITDHALEMLDDSAATEDPFFMYVAYTAPHWPLHALPEDIAHYRGRYLHGWDELRRQRYKRQLELGLIDPAWPLPPKEDIVPNWDDVADKEAMDLKMAVYAAQIDRMDQGIGRILAKIRQLDAEDDTLVIFLSDNGASYEGDGNVLGMDRRGNGLPPGGVDSYMSYGRGWSTASNTPFRMHKKYTHEGGIATPLIVRWPAHITHQGAIHHQCGHVIDLMPTCCQVAGAAYPRSYQGRQVTPCRGQSLLPAFTGSDQGQRTLCWEHYGKRAIRHGDWKLVALENEPWQLYDLRADRTELRDLSSQQPEVVRLLQAKYQSWAEAVGV